MSLGTYSFASMNALVLELKEDFATDYESRLTMLYVCWYA